MTNKQPDAQFDWATELLDAEGHVTLSAKEAKEIGARLRSMGEKLKAYEDLDEAASDVQLLRMGYAAARLEIQSLQARIKTMAEEHADELTVAHLDGRMRAAQPAGAQQPGDCGNTPYDEGPFTLAQQPGAAYAELPKDVIRAVFIENGFTVKEGQTDLKQYVYDAANELLRRARLRASHGQAPAQPAPDVSGYVSEWTSGICTADEAMDGIAKLYAAQAAPTTQPAPQQEPSHTAVQLAELVLSDCGHSSNYTPLLDRVAARIDSHVERRLDELRGCLESKPAPQQEAPAMPSGWVSCTIEFDGSGPEEVAYGPKIMMDRLAKWLGKHFERTIAEKAAPQPLPASQGDALDAARLDWLLLHISGAEFRRIGVHYSGNARRADVDAARKQGANHD